VGSRGADGLGVPYRPPLMGRTRARAPPSTSAPVSRVVQNAPAESPRFRTYAQREHESSMGSPQFRAQQIWANRPYWSAPNTDDSRGSTPTRRMDERYRAGPPSFVGIGGLLVKTREVFTSL